MRKKKIELSVKNEEGSMSVQIIVPAEVVVRLAKSVGIEFVQPKASAKCSCREKQGREFIWGNEC